MAVVELLQKLHVSSPATGEKLLRVIKNPVTSHLPPNSLKIGEHLIFCKCCYLGVVG